MSQTKAQLINAKGDAAFDTNTLYVDAANNRVGIGTSSPIGALDVVSPSDSLGINLRGRSADSIGTFSFYSNDGATNNAQIQMRPSDNELRYLVSGARAQTFYTNGSERVRIDSSGRVGIGTTSPSSILHINQPGDANGITLTHASRTGIWQIEHSGTSSENLGFFQNNGTSKVVSYLMGRDLHYWQTGNTERARIDSSGRLLVGTSSKSATASTTAKGIIGVGGGGGIICAEGQIANNGTIDITVGTSGVHYFTGLLQVNNISASNGADRTQSLISILGNNQGGTISTSTLHTANGINSRSFTITYVATGILRFTNNSGDTCNVQITYIGGGINAS